jgi:hypothetical protein
LHSRNSPNFICCFACPSGQVHGAGHAQPFVTYNECKAVSCFTHQVPLYGSSHCSHYDKLVGDLRSYGWISQDEMRRQISLLGDSKQAASKEASSKTGWRNRISNLLEFRSAASQTRPRDFSLHSTSSSTSTIRSTSHQIEEAGSDDRILRNTTMLSKEQRDIIVKRQKRL